MSRGFYDETTGIFTAPIDGKYKFDLFFAYQTRLPKYDIQTKIDSSYQERWSKFSDSSDYPSGNSFNGDFFSTTISLKKGQTFSIFVEYMYSNGYSVPYCMYANTTVGCSYFQGQLVQ